MSARWAGARRGMATGTMLGALGLVAACENDSVGVAPVRDQDAVELSCSIDPSQILDGGPGKDGIPALTNPETAIFGAGGTEYLKDEDRVIGVVVGSETMAIPLNIMWWHEIVNVDFGEQRLAVTHCPLTGSTLAFDRSPLDGVEFGVSGLLYRNNLIMYDRSADESLWPQMMRSARCGSRSGRALPMYPVVEMTWVGWQTLHPNTRVVTSNTGYGRNYLAYPYGDYDRIDNRDLLFPFTEIDPRRPPKERVLGIPWQDGGFAYPFGELAAQGAAAAVVAGDHVVLWDGTRQAAMAYRRALDGQDLDFVHEGDEITDTQTGSTWRVDGYAIDGPLAGRRLEPIPEAYVAYWFAWAVFQPETMIWSVP